MPYDGRIVPAGRIETEFTERNSRFITNAGPAFSVDAARSFIEEVEKKYPDASHHVPVYIIGHGHSTIAHCSDAGEPSGTAGRPALAVLRGSDVGDVVMVITRYFGGTKLGTGGLVRAYSDSVREALKVLPLARKVATTTLMFVIPYSLYEQVISLANSINGVIVDEDFAVDVTLSVRLDDDRVEVFKDRMVTLTHGRVEFIVVDRQENTLQPL
jgi:uncharacterized YigZ family protein